MQRSLKEKLKICCKTWAKDSHSLYDYESVKIVENFFEFSMSTRCITLLRDRTGSTVYSFENGKAPLYDEEHLEVLVYIEVEHSKDNKVRITLFNPSSYRHKNKKLASEKQKTTESIESVNEHEEEPYVIVSRILNSEGNPSGCKLVPGMTLKLGRIEYYVSEYNNGTERIIKAKEKGKDKSKAYFNGATMKYNEASPVRSHQCKICFEEEESETNFIFNPCKCLGECGAVHFECLQKWIHVKVKKEVIGGTLHYNFVKFQCEVCTTEFPGYVQAYGKTYELMELERPQDNYLVLEGACEKERSIMIVQNTPKDGIRMGRGHECEIRITDISVSRKHAVLKCQNKQFYVYDNKSKFGTLVKEPTMSFEIRREAKPIQIGRTTLDFEIVKTRPG